MNDMIEDPFLPYGRQHIDDDDIAAVLGALRSDYLTTGPAVAAFEAAAASATGARHAIACNSGTAALHLATMALGIEPGDAAIVPAITFVATANVVAHQGGEVIFADVDPATGLMTAETLLAAQQRAGTKRLRAALPVHLAGRVCDMPSLHEIAKAGEFALIEDACHALGGRYTGAGNAPGTVGDCGLSAATAFSLHPVKTAAMGEGGFVSTNDDRIAAHARRMRDHGIVRDSNAFTMDELAHEDGEVNPWYYEMPSPGFNYRVPDIACALGSSQLSKLDRFVLRRRQLMSRYAEMLAPLAPTIAFPAAEAMAETAWHLCPVLIDFEHLDRRRAAVMRDLRTRGIGTQVHYIPVHRQPFYRALAPDLELPGADAYYSRVLALPLFYDMQDSDVDRVVTNLAQVCGLDL